MQASSVGCLFLVCQLFVSKATLPPGNQENGASSYQLEQTFTGYDKYYTSAVAHDGRIFAPPDDASKVLVIDPLRNISYQLDEDYGEGNAKYKTCVTALDGRIFAVPDKEQRILVIDPSRNTSYQLEQDYSGNEQYLTSVLASDGRIFAAPTNADKVLVIDPSQNISYQLAQNYPGNGKYYTSVAAFDGRIFSAPADASKILVIDPSQNASYHLNETYPGNASYVSSVLALNGRIYAVPDSATRVLAIDPFRNISYQLEELYIGTGQYYTSVLGRDGRIFAAPAGAENVLVVEPARNISYQLKKKYNGNGKYVSSVLAPDGRIFAPPNDMNKVLVINPYQNSSFLLEQEYNGDFKYLTCMLAQDGRIFAAPFRPQRVLVVYSGVGITPTSSPTLIPTTINPTTNPTVSPSISPTTTSPSAVPTTDAPSAVPTTVLPSRSPSTLSPSSAPTTHSPTRCPTTCEPTSRLPTTCAPTTLAPMTNAPTTGTPTTGSPTTVVPTTCSPTSSPTSGPATRCPTTCEPTSRSPRTCAPTTLAPMTDGPTTGSPTSVPTSGPTYSPTTSSPTHAPSTYIPTSIPVTDVPSHVPTTAEPTQVPSTNEPTHVPTTSMPTSGPSTERPTSDPTRETTNPTACPSGQPSSTPTETTLNPTVAPTGQPSSTPTQLPTTNHPSDSPMTCSPSICPTTANPLIGTGAPTTVFPTGKPSTECPSTFRPTSAPVTSEPTSAPRTSGPTSAPATLGPTSAPVTSEPTSAPTSGPTSVAPSFLATEFPSISPTSFFPSSSPVTSSPTSNPTNAPIKLFSSSPTTFEPTLLPWTVSPTSNPTKTPTESPTSLIPSTSRPNTQRPSSLSPSTTVPISIPRNKSTLYIRIRSNAHTISESGRIRVTAIATIVNRETNSPEASLQYFWNVTKANNSKSIRNGRSPTLVVDAYELNDHGNFRFEVVVLDSLSALKNRTAVNIVIIPRPHSPSVVISPENGIEFETYFNVTCNTTGGIAPYAYEFESNGRLLRSFSSTKSVSNLVLPAGISNITCTVRDEVGGKSRTVKSISVNSTFPPKVDEKTVVSLFRNCSQISNISFLLREVWSSRRPEYSQQIVSELSLLDALFTAFWQNSTAPLHDLNFRTIRYSLEILRAMPQSNTTLHKCTSFGSEFAKEFQRRVYGTNHSIGLKNDETFTKLGIEIWDALASILQETIQETLNSSGTFTRFATQIVTDLSASPSVNITPSSTRKWFELVRDSQLSTPPELITDTNLGDDTAKALSQLFDLAIVGANAKRDQNSDKAVPNESKGNGFASNIGSNSFCVGIESGINTIDEVLGHAGTALAPGEETFNLRAGMLQGTAQRVFTDIPNIMASNGEVSISAIFGDYDDFVVPFERSEAVLTINTLLGHLSSCRSLRNKNSERSLEDRITNITSINLRNSSSIDIGMLGNASTCRQQLPDDIRRKLCNFSIEIDFPVDTEKYPFSRSNPEDTCGESLDPRAILSRQREIACQFWDPRSQRFSSAGCQLENLNKINQGFVTCKCTHLTEFAVILEQIDSCRESSTEPRAYVYVGLTILYGLLGIVLLRILHKSCLLKRKKKNRYNQFKACCLFFQSVLRIPLCIMLSGLATNFSAKNLPISVILVLLALPHSLMWGSYGMMIYQWAIINHMSRANKLVKNMFKRHINGFYFSLVCLTGIIWASFAIFLFLVNSNARIIGPITMAVVTLGFACMIAFMGKSTIAVTVKVVANSIGRSFRSSRSPTASPRSAQGLQSSFQLGNTPEAVELSRSHMRSERQLYPVLEPNGPGIETNPMKEFPVKASPIASQKESKRNRRKINMEVGSGPGSPRSRNVERIRALSIHVHGLSTLLCLQSWVWILSIIITDEKGLFAGIAAFYFADIVIIALQIDFLADYLCLKKAVRCML